MRRYARDPQNHAYIVHSTWFATARVGTFLANSDSWCVKFDSCHNKI